MRRTVIVLAAGEGTRMHSALPKVMHPLLGRPLLGHVLDASQHLNADHTVVVVGHGADHVTGFLSTFAPSAVNALQKEQLGTGHATRMGLEAVEGLASVEGLAGVEGTVIVLLGDTPLLRSETIANLVVRHEEAGAAATVLTAELPDPTGLGRIVRDDAGQVTGIVEHRDATAAQREICEINSGVMAFSAAALRGALQRLTRNNDQGEEYLTDVIGMLVADGQQVAGFSAPDPTEILGCNDRAQLADLSSRLRDRLNRDHMRAGVTMLDPASTWIDVSVTLEPDVTLEPGVILRGDTVIHSGATIGPDTMLVSCRVGEGATVVRAHAKDARIGDGAQVGPFAYLRPGSVLEEKAKVGTFVETKQTTVGAGAKIPHLTYAGDATIGAGANIGAATIFVNYDGVNKHHTVVGESAFVGCDTSLVAPVEVGPGAYVAAGSVITKDVPAGALGVTRATQRNIEGWVQRRRPGTRAAAAAEGVDRTGGAEGAGESA